MLEKSLLSDHISSTYMRMLAGHALYRKCQTARLFIGGFIWGNHYNSHGVLLEAFSFDLSHFTVKSYQGKFSRGKKRLHGKNATFPKEASYLRVKLLRVTTAIHFHFCQIFWRKPSSRDPKLTWVTPYATYIVAYILHSCFRLVLVWCDGLQACGLRNTERISRTSTNLDARQICIIQNRPVYNKHRPRCVEYSKVGLDLSTELSAGDLEVRKPTSVAFFAEVATTILLNVT